MNSLADPEENHTLNPEEPKLLAFMQYDRAQAEQGNIDNPYKGACDDVFRDLRQTLVYAIDFGGVTPASYNHLLKGFYSVHNRVANGNCIELMEKVEALISADVIDVSFSKANILSHNEQIFLHSTCDHGKLVTVDTIIACKLHNFSVARAQNPLFRDLQSNGIAARWIHQDFRGVEGDISAFDLTEDFQILNSKGKRENIYCVGQPSEGMFFFQNGSIRPNVNHHVANDILKCLKAFKKTALPS